MKYLLEDDFEYDFQLVGISCHERDYRVCWGVNHSLALALSKQEKVIEVFHKKNNRHSRHTLFSIVDFDSEQEVHLIANRSKSGYLVPEQKHADYLLLIKGDDIISSTEAVAKLKRISFVLTAFSIEVSQLKSKENLIF
ncbi:MAG: IPExxxVDY family protein [Flavobacteriales bacterium]|jgi:hypothetical protein|nr:IPExxxVDY family protein [Flavobacteriales bacterium]